MHPIKQALLDYSRMTFVGEAKDALAEWEKIEKAANEWVAGVKDPGRSDWASTVPESIAKEAE